MYDAVKKRVPYAEYNKLARMIIVQQKIVAADETRVHSGDHSRH